MVGRGGRRHSDSGTFIAKALVLREGWCRGSRAGVPGEPWAPGWAAPLARVLEALGHCCAVVQPGPERLPLDAHASVSRQRAALLIKQAAGSGHLLKPPYMHPLPACPRAGAGTHLPRIPGRPCSYRAAATQPPAAMPALQRGSRKEASPRCPSRCSACSQRRRSPEQGDPPPSFQELPRLRFAPPATGVHAAGVWLPGGLRAAQPPLPPRRLLPPRSRGWPLHL
jgi:hypothetical protein